MQQFIIKTSPHRIAPCETQYDFLRRHHRVPNIKALRSAERRILVVRDPVERILSLYQNKFVQRSGSVGLFRSFTEVTGYDPVGVSLDDFITNYVSRLGDIPLDPHVWPQHWHLCPIVYDYVFSLTDLAEGMTQIVGPRMAADFFQQKVNTSPEFDLEVGAETRARIETIYAEDFRMLDRIT